MNVLNWVYAAVNESCNLNCSYCFMPKENRTKKAIDANGTEFANKLVKTLEDCDASIYHLTLFSAEATMYSPQVLGKMISKLHERVDYIRMLTNGVKLSDREYFRQFINEIVHIDRLSIQFSLDGPIEINEINRGFVGIKTYKAITMCEMYGLEHLVRITVTNASVENREVFIQWLKELRLRHKQCEVSVGPVEPKYTISIDEFKPEEMTKQVQLCEDVLNMGLSDDMDRYSKRTAKQIEDVRNGADSGLVIDLEPCSDVNNGGFTKFDCDIMLLKYDGLMADCSVGEHDLYDRWDDGRIVEQYKNRTAKYHYDVAEECHECEFKLMCGNGCWKYRSKNGYAYDCMREKK